MKKKNPTVSIIIANFNGEAYLQTCLESVLKTAYDNFDVIVVDDGSADNSKQIIKKIAAKNKKITVLINTHNIGLSRSRNRAIEASKSDILVFLDNDTQVTQSWIKNINKVLLSQDSVGGVQSKLIEFDQRTRIQLIGTKLIPYTGWSVPLGKGAKKERFTRPMKIIGIGAAFAVKREVIQTIGVFDRYMVYFNEDLDYSWRIWIAGWKVLLAPDSIVYHWTKSPNMRKNTNSTLEKIYYNMCRNSTRSMLKNYQLQSLLYYFPINLFILFARAILVLVRRKDISSLKGTVRSLYWNLTHISDTLIERQKIQNVRKLSDAYLYNEIMVEGSLKHVYEKYFSQTRLL